MANEKPFTYLESQASKLTDKDVTDQIRFQISKNNVKEPKHESKKIVWNPLSALLLHPHSAPYMWFQKARYNKKINEGRVDEITEKEKRLFESKLDPNRKWYQTTKFVPRNLKKEVDIVADVAEGAVTGPPLAIKSLAEFLTIGVDKKLDTNFTKKLDEVTRKFLKHTGEPETLAGEITQIATQFLIPFKIIDKIIGNIGKLKYLKNKTFFMQNAKLANKHRLIKSTAGLAQRMGTGALSLGATDFLISGGERKLDPIFYKRTKEEGKTGRELAAARLSNKIKYGKEGAMIGAGFPLVGVAFGGAVRTLGYGVGVTYDVLGGVINPFYSAITKTLAKDPLVLPALAQGFRSNVDFIFNQIGTRVVLTGMGRTKQWTQQLPDYQQWRKFTVDNLDEVKSGLKKIDKAISWIRSAGPNTAEALSIKGYAGREIRASAKRIQDLLKSIELKNYELAKGFQELYNTNKTSPSLMNQYADEIVEVLEGTRKLTNLPEILRPTVKLLKDDLVKINKIFNKYVPQDESFAHALNGATKKIIKKSFAFLSNPNYAMPATDPIFVNAAKFAAQVIRKDKGLISEAMGYAGKGASRSQAIKDYSQVMIKQFLAMGKVDNKNPFEVLRKIGQRLNLEGFLKEGEELPKVINKLLGKGTVTGMEGLKNNVLFTTSSMMTAVANKQMYDTLARVMLKQGQVFTDQYAARAGKQTAEVVQIGRIEGLSGLKTTLSNLWTDAETARILTTNKGPLDILAQIPAYASFLQFKAGVQWGKTVGSPATGSRNFVTAADFALMRGLIGGRASVTNAVKMQVDDIYNSGKLVGSAEKRLLDNIEEGIKYGALDENIVVTELRELLAATQKGKTINSFDTLIKAAGNARIVELMGKLYAGGDHVWKWYGYNWYKSFLTDYAGKGKVGMDKMVKWFRTVANKELDLLNIDGTKKTLAQAIKEASAYYVRNTMPTYSKVPMAIKGVRNLPLGNFVAFPAETLRGSFNVMNISTKEILSGDPILREMGYRGLIGMFTTQGAKGLAIMKTYGALTGLTQDIMKEYQANLAPGYQRNSQLLAITKAVKGKFKMVDLSTVLPYDYVRRPWEALNNAIVKKRLTSQNSTNFILGLAFDEEGPVREFFDPFIATPIGLEAFLDIKRGYTKTGKKIWSELDSDEAKWEKSWEYFYNTLEPGAITTLRQMYSAYTGVPYKGRVHDMQDVLMGLATGVKPYDVDVNKNIDFLVNDYTRIRIKAWQASNLYDTDTNNENGEIEKEFINIQRNIWKEQRRIYRAFKTAQLFDVDYYDIKKEMKERNLPRSDIRKILNGDFDALPFSEKRFKGKLKELEEMNREWNKKHPNNKRNVNRNSFYPKYELKDILRDLKYQRLDEPFFYDKIKEPPIEIKDQTRLVVPDKKITSLPQNTNVGTTQNVPAVNPNLIASTTTSGIGSGGVNQMTGLTASQNALVSDPLEREYWRKKNLRQGTA